MNDADRKDWVNNDEGLYNMFRRSGLSITKFVMTNRAFLDECIGNVTSGRKPAHYKAYGG